MIGQASKWIGMVAGAMSIVWVPSLCLAQQEIPTIDKIVQVWKARQEKVTSARFELSEEETIHKGSTSFADSIVFRKELEPNPSRDYAVKATAKISLDGPKLRYSYNHQAWDPIGKKLFPQYYVDVFDGELSKSLQIPTNGVQDYPEGGVRKTQGSGSALNFPIVPLIFAFRGNHPQFFPGLGEFKLMGRTTVIAERSCLELVQESKPGSGSSEQREVFYLDQQRDYVVVRKTTFLEGQPTWQLDVIYNSDREVGWVPRSWEYIIRAGKDRQVVQSGRNTVTSYKLNPQIDGKEFDIEFPPRTRVFDESSGKEVQYVIREGGEKGRQIPVGNNPKYEDLDKPAQRFNGWWFISFWAAILVLALGGLIWKMRRRRLSEKES